MTSCEFGSTVMSQEAAPNTTMQPTPKSGAADAERYVAFIDENV